MRLSYITPRHTFTLVVPGNTDEFWLLNDKRDKYCTRCFISAIQRKTHTPELKYLWSLPVSVTRERGDGFLYLVYCWERKE